MYTVSSHLEGNHFRKRQVEEQRPSQSKPNQDMVAENFQVPEMKKISELGHQKMIRPRKRLEDLAHSDPEYAKALDTKECMLEVQGMLLGKLATEENHVKGFVMLPGFCITDFEERAIEVRKVTQGLQY